MQNFVTFTLYIGLKYVEGAWVIGISRSYVVKNRDGTDILPLW